MKPAKDLADNSGGLLTAAEINIPRGVAAWTSVVIEGSASDATRQANIVVLNDVERFAGQAMTNDAAARARAARRTREYRTRKRERVVLARLRISAFTVFALQRLGWLSDADAQNARAIGNAFAAMGNAALVRGLRAPPPTAFDE